MHPLLAGADWPALPAPYDAALREAAEYVAARFDVLGLVASGTVVRGNPDPASDLDLVVIHAAPFRQRIQRRFGGVPAEIFVNTPGSARAFLREERAEARPVLAHMLATGHPVLSLDPVVEALRREARAELDAGPPRDEAALNRARYAAATRFEDARDRAAADPETVRWLLADAVVGMLRHHVRAAGFFIPRDKELLARVEALDAGAGALARRVLAAREVGEQLGIAERLADRTLGVRGFYAWESEAEPVPPEGGEAAPARRSTSETEGG